MTADLDVGLIHSNRSQTLEATLNATGHSELSPNKCRQFTAAGVNGAA